MFGGNFNGEAGNGNTDEWNFETFNELNSITGAGHVMALTKDGAAAYA